MVDSELPDDVSQSRECSNRFSHLLPIRLINICWGLADYLSILIAIMLVGRRYGSRDGRYVVVSVETLIFLFERPSVIQADSALNFPNLKCVSQ